MGWHSKRHWYSFMVTLTFETLRPGHHPLCLKFPHVWYWIQFSDTFIDCALEVRSGVGHDFPNTSPHLLVCNRTGSSLASLGSPRHRHTPSIITITSPNHTSTCSLACPGTSFLKLASACPHLTLHSSLNTTTSLILPLYSCPFRDSGNCIYSSSPVFCCFAFLSSASSNLLKLILLMMLIIFIVTN